MAQITYENKVKINDNPSIPNINKVTDADMNEIKDVVNENYQELTNLITNDTGYTKDDKGTLICYGKTPIFNISAGGEHQENITLPENFLSNDFTVIVSIISGGAGWADVICRGGATSENTIRIIAGNYISSSEAQNIAIGYMAIGKWK
jgi:hypothetical protein